jgi:hypothetical protein
MVNSKIKTVLETQTELNSSRSLSKKTIINKKVKHDKCRKKYKFIPIKLIKKKVKKPKEANNISNLSYDREPIVFEYNDYEEETKYVENYFKGFGWNKKKVTK